MRLHFIYVIYLQALNFSKGKQTKQKQNQKPKKSPKIHEQVFDKAKLN